MYEPENDSFIIVPDETDQYKDFLWTLDQNQQAIESYHVDYPATVARLGTQLDSDGTEWTYHNYYMSKHVVLGETIEDVTSANINNL